MQSENRTCKRIMFNKTICFQMSIVKPSQLQGIPFSGLGLDISEGGLGLITEFIFRKGDVLKLLIPANEVTTHPAPVFAEVIWTKYAGENFRTGLRFLK